MSIRCAVLAFAGLLMLTQSATSAQQTQGSPSNRIEDFSALAGRWQADPPFKQAEGPKPRFVNTLVIGVTAQEITIDRGYSPTERYRPRRHSYRPGRQPYERRSCSSATESR